MKPMGFKISWNMSGLHLFLSSRNIGCKETDNLRMLVMPSVRSRETDSSPACSKVYGDEQGMFWEGILSILLGEDESFVEHPLQSIQRHIHTHTHTHTRTHTHAYICLHASSPRRKESWDFRRIFFPCQRTFAMLARGGLKANGDRIYRTQWKRSSWSGLESPCLRHLMLST